MGRRVALPRWVIDWSPVVVLPPVLVTDAVLSTAGNPLTVLNVLSAFVATLPLVLRHRLVVWVQIPLIVAGVVLVMWQLHPGNTVVLIPMVALYELAYHGDRRRSLWCALLSVPGVLAGVLPFTSGAEQIASVVARNLVLCLLAIAAGDVLRSRHEIAQRTADAREQQTLRRVADERLAIAHEIHDVVAHAMTAINVQAGVAAHLLERDPGQAHRALRDIKRVSGEALGELRATLAMLREPGSAAPLTAGGGRLTGPDLAGLAAGLQAAGVRVSLEIEALEDLPDAVHRAGYRIVQEALTNVARHAHAAHARVSVATLGGAVAIEIADDGSADCDPAVAAAAGNGLRGMRERALALGGTLQAGPTASGGWSVQARLPLPAPAPPAVPAGA